MNKKSVYILFVMFIHFVGGFHLLAQDSLKVDAWDRSAVDYRPASKEVMEEYKQMDEYIYDRFQKPESFWDKVKRWLIAKLFSSKYSGNIVFYLLIGFAVLILLFVVLKLLGVRISGLFIFAQDTKVDNLKFKLGEDDIYNENLERTLSAAIKNKAYREAVRLMYLLALRHMDSAELIDWKPWKTNKEYYYELKSAHQKEMFSQLVLSYEYIWYGQFEVLDDKFSEVHSLFQRFEQTLSSGKKTA
ncbi:DUF4129 domain-containing protein [Labilibacter marinus]|uniref:DUF4129 domain-containing protein n=1 Tax=Labilibacter marinus TaxID=1477105 RepID=UPI00082BB17F|nr:DUF4129 domain-containing protein [Labilibacter marinus]